MRNVTLTMIFEASANNRDEKIGGNIQSVKKLKRKDGTYSFLGKSALRHYLFQTLLKSPQTRAEWDVVNTHLRSEDVLQFDVSRSDILSSAEMDLFGYMFTGNRTYTRKAPLGITKAISLEPYEGDMTFYANHDLVDRARKNGVHVEPNPFNKEEHISFYKASFTIDSNVFGKDVWIVQARPEYSNHSLSIDLDGVLKSLACTAENNGQDTFAVTTQNGHRRGTVRIEPIADAFKVIFEVDRAVRSDRMTHVLNALRNGVYARASGEDNAIVPLFIIGAAVRVPSPVLHPFIDLRQENGRMKVIGVQDGLRSDWIETATVDADGRQKQEQIVFIQDCERLKVHHPTAMDWQTFIGHVLQRTEE